MRDSVDQIFGTIFEPAARSTPARPAPVGTILNWLLGGRSPCGSTAHLHQDLVAAGQVCDQDNLSDEDRELAKSGHLVCQRTDETIEGAHAGAFHERAKGRRNPLSGWPPA